MPPTVTRGNLVRTLYKLLQGETVLVAIEGQEGIGKTTLLREFRAARPDDVIMVELNAASSFAYDESRVGVSLTEAAVRRALQREATDAELRDWRTSYNSAVISLSRSARRDDFILYFILDGISDIPLTEVGAREALVRLLPFGVPEFRFLVSGELSTLGLHPSILALAKPWQVPFLTRDDVARYFAPLALPDESTSALYELTQGIPGHMAAVYRVASQGADLASIGDGSSDLLLQVFAHEWSGTADLRSEGMLALAVMAFSHNTLSLTELARCVALPEDDLSKLLGRLSFVAGLDSGRPRYASEPLRRFASVRLSEWEARANDALIDHFLMDPESEAALSQVPALYRRQGRLAEVLKFLTPERFARLCHRAPSLRIIREATSEAIAAARELGSETEFVRFVVQGGVVEQAAQSQAGLAEVAAIAALGDVSGAIAVASSARQVEIRFRQLAAIARIQNERTGGRDPELVDQLRALYQQLEPTALAEGLSGTLVDVFSVAPDLALEILGNARQQRGENALDWALAGLSILQHVVERKKPLGTSGEDLTAQIKYGPAKRLALEAAVILGKFDAERAIREAEALEGTADKLYILQNWMRANYRRPDAHAVLDHGVRLALQASGYSASATVYRELAVCLPYIEAAHTRQYFIDFFDGQQAELERVGPREDVVRLQLTLAAALWPTDREQATSRLLELCLGVEAIKEPVTRVACMGRCIAALELIDAERELEESDGLHSMVKEGLVRELAFLRTVAGDHAAACIPAIRAIARCAPELAQDQCACLNLEWRRDAAFHAFVEAVLGGPIRESDASAVVQSLGRIVDPRVRDEALEYVVAAIRRERGRVESLVAAIPLVGEVRSIGDLGARAFACAQVIAIYQATVKPADGEAHSLSGPIAALKITLREAWESTLPTWGKLYRGFDIVSTLAASEPDLARSFVDEINRLKTQLDVREENSGEAAAVCLHLAVRGVTELQRRGVDADSQVSVLVEHIAQVEDFGVRMRLWVDLAVRSFFAGGRAEAERITQERIVPLVHEVPIEQVLHRGDLIQLAAPALYLGTRAAGMALINSLPGPRRDEALTRIAQCLLRRISPWDPYHERAGVIYPLTYDDASALVELAGMMESDSSIDSVVADLCRSLMGHENLVRIKSAQRAELIRNLRKIVAERLPAARFIQHDGYSIVAEGAMATVGDAGSFGRELESLRERAGNVPNRHDQLYILLRLAALCRDGGQRRRLLDEVIEAAAALPLLVDRIDLLSGLARDFVDSEPERSESAMREAWRLASEGEGESVAERRESLVSVACQLFPDVAGSIASVRDDDPAKRRMEGELLARRLSGSLTARRQDGVSESQAELRDWAKAAWYHLGSVMAGRALAPAMERLQPALLQMARQQVYTGYPVFALLIESASRSVMGKEATRRQIVPLFDAFMDGAVLALQLGRTSEAARRPLGVEVGLEGGSILVGEGERNRGVEEIRRWLVEERPAEVVIVDPFFKPSDVPVLGLLREIRDDVRITVLTGRPMRPGPEGKAPEAAYREAWRQARDDTPPDTTFIAVRTRGKGVCPFHDRWWLGVDAGVACGTSIGGLGMRLSEVRRLEAEEVRTIRSGIDQFLTRQMREWSGERLEYLSFDL